MRYLAYHENLQRGTFDFPAAYYPVDIHHPRYEMPHHWHTEIELIRVIKGCFNLSIDGESMQLNLGDCAFIPGGKIHGGVPRNAVYECLVLNANRLLIGYVGQRHQISVILEEGISVRDKFSAGSEAATIIGSTFDIVKLKTPGYEIQSAGLLLQLIGFMLRNKHIHCVSPDSHQSKRILGLKNTLRRIHQDYAHPLTLDELAAECGLSPLYFCRVFRQFTGRTPIDYLNYYRIECAAEMLKSTQGSITDTALNCGFNDLSYFIRTFRRYKGDSPKNYRLKYGEESLKEN